MTKATRRHEAHRYGRNATIAPQLNHTTTPASMARPMRNTQNALRIDDSAPIYHRIGQVQRWWKARKAEQAAG